MKKKKDCDGTETLQKMLLGVDWKQKRMWTIKANWNLTFVIVLLFIECHRKDDLKARDFWATGSDSVFVETSWASFLGSGLTFDADHSKTRDKISLGNRVVWTIIVPRMSWVSKIVELGSS